MLIRFLFHSLSIITLVALVSCSTINKKDCDKNMNIFGLRQGRVGSPKKYTDEIRNTCLSRNPNLDLEAYEKGFAKGWDEYCTPTHAFDMGKKSDRYISFCPADREAQFREKYLIGKHYFELKDVESDIVGKMNDLRPNMNKSTLDYDDYTKLQTELDKVKREYQALEVEGTRQSFKYNK
ncbi:MAG: DUF2799 domain-containing protein [Bacteriovorax sp.]|nr:DUF2799 domain-containing protein [Bacteriovorax sp.]